MQYHIKAIAGLPSYIFITACVEYVELGIKQTGFELSVASFPKNIQRFV